MNLRALKLCSSTPRVLPCAARRCAISLALLLVVAHGSAPAQQAAPPKLYAQLQGACVEILVDGQLAGSGAIADPRGRVLTAAHLFSKPGSKLEILSRKLGRQNARLIALDDGHDLALLTLSERDEKYPALVLAQDVPAAGNAVWLFGAPMFRHAVLFPGMVAGAENTCEYVDGHFVVVRHISAATPRGVSGGAWVNRAGELVGVQSSMLTLDGVPQGLGFAAPVAAAKRLVTTGESAATPTLAAAIEELWEQSPDALAGLPAQSGLYVRSLHNDGAAARAGVQAGDVIIAVDGKPLVYRWDLVQSIRAKRVGDDIKLTLVSPGGAAPRTATAKLQRLERLELLAPDTSDDNQPDN